MPRWVPAIAAAAVLGVVIIAGVSGGGGGSGVADTGPHGDRLARGRRRCRQSAAGRGTVETDAPIVKVPLANGTIGHGYQATT